jgi:hypothetical protein
VVWPAFRDHHAEGGIVVLHSYDRTMTCVGVGTARSTQGGGGRRHRPRLRSWADAHSRQRAHAGYSPPRDNCPEAAAAPPRGARRDPVARHRPGPGSADGAHHPGSSRCAWANGWASPSPIGRCSSTPASRWPGRPAGSRRRGPPELKETYERWDGKGAFGARGEEIRLASRLIILADVVSVFHGIGGLEAAVARRASNRLAPPRRRRGGPPADRTRRRVTRGRCAPRQRFALTSRPGSVGVYEAASVVRRPISR